MIIVSCITQTYGLLFNNRRISQDRAILKLIYNQFINFKKEHSNIKFYMNDYSYSLFLFYLNNLESNLKYCEYNIFIKSIIVSDSFLLEAEQYDFCFVENNDVLSFFYNNNVTGTIFYKWDKTYPCDYYLSLPIDFAQNFVLQTITEHIGHSHSTILEEIYKNEKNS